MPITEQHLETIRQWRNSDEVKKYMYTDDQITPDQQQRWFESIKTRQDERHWLVSCAGREVGIVNLKKIDLKKGEAEWAFYLGEPGTRGKGIGVLIEFKLLDYVFNELGLKKLNCAVLMFNEKVIELHKKFGFVQEGILSKQVKKNDELIDVVRLGITQEAWAQKRPKLTGIVRKLTGNEER